VLADGRAFLLPAAGLTVTRACRKQIETFTDSKSLVSLPGWSARWAAGQQQIPVPGEATGARGPGRRGQAATSRLARSVNAQTAPTGRYPGFTCSLIEKFTVLFSDRK